MRLRSEKKERLFQLLVVKSQLSEAPYVLDLFINQIKATMEAEDIKRVEEQVNV